MLMSASSEFIALCREQMALLAQGLGASLSVVYLTQELVEAPTNEAKLIPLVVYPEAAVGGQSTNALALPTLNQKLLTAAKDFPVPSKDSETEDRTLEDSAEESLLSGDKIVLPLVYEDVMMGLLVTAREDRAWNEQERSRIESIARTLAIACILDQRRTWLEVQLHQQQILQEKQQDLLDNLLHQFRNPLTALRTFGKLLLKRLRPGDPNREVAESIVRESDRLQELLKKFDEVIDLGVENLAPLKLPEQEEIFVEATVEKEHKPPLLLPGTGEKEADCYITDILQPLLISAQAIAQERNLQLTANIPSNLPLVRANRKALTEVFSNIIDNALKYTPAGGKVLIEAGQQKDNLQGVAITDTGPGIPPEDLAHLGERHYRGVQAQTEIPGTGLGIAIAKQLIEQMHGEIEVKSPALNPAITSPQTPGTTFIVWLPIANS
ncbi:GAF domain-containing sensor histidine kinase [Fischerella thermalis]|uniref:GAF domain-containing sensor histidine kinase n=1 Tax=Fischerella thermalis TaxID=372787 RepID=UPI0019FBE906|nr:ATP-binding protein [Fischerella thermalis]MBF1988920.1 sensor histidine kinase [Fischerella thermalis M58_A2018_009]MBF2062428.1 sensor histidine kinase [Fischerella thermalis M66_A2018_004]